jgi:hypothetical protein
LRPTLCYPVALRVMGRLLASQICNSSGYLGTMGSVT